MGTHRRGPEGYSFVVVTDRGQIKHILGIPRSVHTFALIPIGWPLGKLGPAVVALSIR